MQLTTYSYLSDFVHWNDLGLYSTCAASDTENYQYRLVQVCKPGQGGSCSSVWQQRDIWSQSCLALLSKSLASARANSDSFLSWFSHQQLFSNWVLMQSLSSLPFVITKSGKESRLIAVPVLDLWLIQFIALVSNSHRVFTE